MAASAGGASSTEVMIGALCYQKDCDHAWQVWKNSYIVETQLQQCPPGKQMVAGLCYTDACMDDPMVRLIASRVSL